MVSWLLIYAILNAVKRTLADKQAKKENTVLFQVLAAHQDCHIIWQLMVFILYMERAPAFATGIKLTNPELDVWIITGGRFFIYWR